MGKLESRLSRLEASGSQVERRKPTWCQFLADLGTKFRRQGLLPASVAPRTSDVPPCHPWPCNCAERCQRSGVT
jgi:hypothetical protein